MKGTGDVNVTEIRERGKSSSVESISTQEEELSSHFAGQSENRIYSDRSDTVSFREKIRERFKFIKEQIATTPKSDKPVDYITTLKLLKEENSAVESSLSAYKGARTSQYSTAAEAFNFFCEHLDSDCDFATAVADGEETASVRRELTTAVPAYLLDEFVRVASEKCLWTPKRQMIQLDAKIDNVPRVLSDEGFHESAALKISYLNVLEQRLLTVNDKRWFDSEGSLRSIDDPTSTSSYRPRISLEADNATETKYTLPYQNEDTKTISSVIVGKPNILQLNVSNVKFNHHPLFSAEHVFKTQLLQLFEKYREKVNGNKIERVTRCLQNLRDMRDDSRNFRESGNNIAKKRDEFSNEIKKLRTLQLKESAEMRDLTRGILETWKCIKAIRKKNGYATTNVSLIIRKEKTVYHEDLLRQQEEIDSAVSEILTEMETEYERKLNEWKRNRDSDSNKKSKKPPFVTGEDQVRHDVFALVKNAFRPPGEPVLTFNISGDNDVDDEIENKNEMLRRRAVKSTKIFFKIIYDDVHVCKSKIVSLDDDFDCSFQENLLLQVNNVPNVVVVEIYEISTLSKRKLAQIHLKVPHISNRFVDQESCVEHFEKDEIVHYKHDGVGSNVDLESISNRFDINLKQNAPLNTNGFITYSMRWEELLAAETNGEDAQHRILNGDGRVDVQKLTEWVKSPNVDPQNPSNVYVFEYIDAYKRGNHLNESPNVHFRCNPDLQKLTFYDPSKIETNVRLEVLQLRNRNEPEFLGMYVPNRLKEIPVNILSGHNQRKRQEQMNVSTDVEDGDTIDRRRSHGFKYLKGLHTKMYQRCRRTRNNLNYYDVVNEKMIAYFQNWIQVAVSNVFNWFKIRPATSKPLPKLASPPSEGKSLPTTTTSGIGPSTNIVVHVVSAKNVPHKIISKRQSTTRSVSEILDGQRPSVFVEAIYENMVLSTSIGDGANPKWDEKLIFPLRGKHTDYMNREALDGSFVLSLFNESRGKHDVVIIDWLGYLTIPLSAIAYNDKMTGFFQLKSPVFLNYEQNVIHVELNVWMEPKFPKLTLDMEDLPSNEPPYLQKHILNWNKRFNGNYPNRQFSAMAMDANGKTVCLTRFIKALEMPYLAIDDYKITQEHCARYISLVPFIDCSKLYSSICLSTEDMLKISIGTCFDHAIALVCYFLALDIEAWLVVGYGIPKGHTAYVLTTETTPKNEISFCVYDVTIGSKYNVTDTLCPLQKIFCVMNDQNIWANTQRTNQLNLTQFDFTKGADWLPLFNNQVHSPSSSVQKKLNYCLTNNLSDFEQHIEAKLKWKIIKYRKTARTIWNHTLSNHFKQYLKSLENTYVLIKHDASHIKNMNHNQTVHGFIIDLPYSSLTALFQTIKCTKAFSTDVPSEDFVFAVHIHSYPNKILAVWMMIGFVLPK